jgi:hypothetical protein
MMNYVPKASLREMMNLGFGMENAERGFKPVSAFIKLEIKYHF